LRSAVSLTCGGRQSYTLERKPCGSATASIATDTAGTLATSRQAPGIPGGHSVVKGPIKEREVDDAPLTVSVAVLR